ncbi:MAG: zf-TFIIB domain-containing protein [Eubacteriales bacterium]|nr:zf-TFIIB domain-containing protein [Eubacteriales bacterium]
MNKLGDHPIIHNMETTGYPDGKAADYPKCPVCGAEAEEFYKFDGITIVGCDNCIDRVNAWEEQERLDTYED